jgi:hypothetical protein
MIITILLLPLGHISFRFIKLQLMTAREVVNRQQLGCGYGVTTLSAYECVIRRRLKHTYLGLASHERTMARQRAKVAWLNEGDANTTFFHQHASYRRQKCVVRSLQVDSAVVLDHAAMAEASFSHLKALHAPRYLMDREFSLDLDFLGFGTEDLSNLS